MGGHKWPYTDNGAHLGHTHHATHIHKHIHSFKRTYTIHTYIYTNTHNIKNKNDLIYLLK